MIIHILLKKKQKQEEEEERKQRLKKEPAIMVTKCQEETGKMNSLGTLRTSI